MFCDCSGADSDGSDGKKLMPSELKVTDPTVTVRDVECSKNIENTEFSENDKISEGDGNLQNSDGKTDLGDGKATGDGKLLNSDGNFVIVDGRKIELYTASFRDVLKQSEAKLRRKMTERKEWLSQSKLAQ